MAKQHVIISTESDYQNKDNSIHMSDIEQRSLQNELSAEIQTLGPFSTYDIRMYAENRIGMSNPSTPTIRIKTKEEAPEGPPTSIVAISNSSQSLVITWKVIKQTFQCVFIYHIEYQIELLIQMKNPLGVFFGVCYIIETALDNTHFNYKSKKEKLSLM